MIQTLVAIVIVGGCAGWLGWMGYRFFVPKAGGKACGGGCCDGEVKPVVKSGPPQERVVMISSDDMRNRIKARRG